MCVLSGLYVAYCEHIVHVCEHVNVWGASSMA